MLSSGYTSVARNSLTNPDIKALLLKQSNRETD